MKICLLCGSFPPERCGVGDYTFHLAKKLSRAGTQVRVVTTRSLAPGSGPEKSGIKGLLPGWSLLRLPRLLRLLRSENPGVIHVQYPSRGMERGQAPLWLFPWLRLRADGARRIVTLHEFANYSWKGRLRLWPLLWGADRVICTNHLDRRALRAWRIRARVIPLGSNVGEKPGAGSGSLAGKYHLARDRKWVLHFGSVMPNKGWETLIRALEILRDRGIRVGLLAMTELAPERYAYHRRVAERIQASGLDADIRFTGYLPAREIAALSLKVPLAVQPYWPAASLNRGSLVALLVLGRALILTQPPAPLETLRPGIHYWPVAPGDTRSLAGAMEELLRRPEKIRALQAAGRSVRSRFLWSAVARQVLEVYQNPV